MKIGEFTKVNQTTRDTVRYYIEEGLLKPVKVNGYYEFGADEQEDLIAIKELRELGFSIKGIKNIQLNRIQYGCGTLEQHQHNQQLVSEELAEIKVEMALLQQRKIALTKILGQFLQE